MYSNISQILLLYKTWRYNSKFDSTKSLGYVTNGQNITLRVNWAWIKRYCGFFLSKTYNTLHSCHNFPVGLREAARVARICETSLLIWIVMPFGRHNAKLNVSITSVTRSTPRAQISTAPSLKSVKQSTQAWSSVAYCFLCTYPENFLNVHPSGIAWCCQQTRTQKIEKGNLCPRG